MLKFSNPFTILNSMFISSFFFILFSISVSICAGALIMIEYDTPWYCMMSLSRSAKPDEAPSAPKFKVEINPKEPSVAKKRRANPARRKRTLDLSDPVEARVASTAPNEDGEIVESTD